MRIVMLILMFIMGASAAMLFMHLRAAQIPQGQVARVQNSFDFTIAAPMKTVAPLFGAWEEKRWAGTHWDPRFVWPQPARDAEGEVFTISHGHLSAVWVNTALDLEHGFIQYVYVIPGAQTAKIDIHLKEGPSGATTAHVTYTRTSLDPSLNEHITNMGESDSRAGKEWETGIAEYLKTQK